ncbi:MAG: hypothetical protein ACR2P4_09415 [Gammaproteobacteria bacterium]
MNRTPLQGYDKKEIPAFAVPFRIRSNPPSTADGENGGKRAAEMSPFFL